MSAPDLTTSVVVATYCRPDHVRTCLEHLARQSVPPGEIVVVDASPDDRTRLVVEGFQDVRYLRNERGAGSTATSRAIGLAATHGEIVAFVDDDAYASPDWLAQLLIPYAEASVAAVGGRVRNGRPGEETQGRNEVGRLLHDGRLSGNFGADPGRPVDVDHVLGASMSYRRAVAERLGGVHDYYPGTCLREETDLPLRMRRAGYRVVFTPYAVVDHVAGPYAKGRRFDLRYTYYGQRNHVVLLSRTLGGGDPHLRRYLRSAVKEIGEDAAYAVRAVRFQPAGGRRRSARAVAGGLSRAVVKAAGLAAGGAQAALLRLTEGPVARAVHPPSDVGSSQGRAQPDPADPQPR